MAVQQKDKQPTEQERPERRQLNALIGKHVLDTLGQPADLHLTQVRPLWEDCYRVNIFVGADAANIKIAHSFFLVVDGVGNIVTSSPPIKKRYGKVEV